jgi:hypothetical protein
VNNLFRIFSPLIAFQIIKNKERLRINSMEHTECIWGKGGLHGGNVKSYVLMTFIMFLNVQFATGGQITQAPTVTVSHVVTERNIFLLLSCELDNGHYEVSYQ